MFELGIDFGLMLINTPTRVLWLGLYKMLNCANSHPTVHEKISPYEVKKNSQNGQTYTESAYNLSKTTRNVSEQCF